MRRRHTLIEARLINWAMCREQPPHDPGRPSESIEYRMMTTGQVCRGGIIGDGGLSRALQRFRSDIARAQRASETHRIVKRMQYRDDEAFQVVVAAFLDRPGYIMPGHVGAGALGIGQSAWRMRYQRGLAFVDGALMAAA